MLANGSINVTLYVHSHMPINTGPELKSSFEYVSTRSDAEASIATNELNSTPEVVEKADILVAGSLAIDLACDYAPFGSKHADITPKLNTSNPSIINQSLGGVGHNVALAASYLGSSVLFCSVVSDDLSGRAALSSLKKKSGIQPEGIQVLGSAAGTRTAQYVAINDAKKDLMVAMADMSILELSSDYLNFAGFWEPLISRTRPNWVVVDANWSVPVLDKWISLAKQHNAKVAFEPVSTAKSLRLFAASHNQRSSTIPTSSFDSSSLTPAIINSSTVIPNNKIDLITPNSYELTEIYAAAREAHLFESSAWWEIIDSLSLPSSGSRERLVSLTSRDLVDRGIPQQSIQLLPYLPCILTKLGQNGVLLTQILKPGDERLTHPDHAKYVLGRTVVHENSDDKSNSGIGGVYMRLFPPAEVVGDKAVVSVNGAGDTLLGVVVAGLAKSGQNGNYGGLSRLENIIPVAQRASERTLRSYDAVSAEIKGLAPFLD